MAITKFREYKNNQYQKSVLDSNNLLRVIKYNCRETKTDHYKNIYASNLADETYLDENFVTDTYYAFLANTEKRKMVNDRSNIKREYDEFYISWSPEESKTLEPEKAMKIIKEICNEFLGNDYQYLITIHNDADHLHGHILFNLSNIHTHKMFKSHRENIHLLREINDRVNTKYGLSVITEKKNKHTSRRELMSRRYNRSFKSKVEKRLDEIISNCSSYEQYINVLKEEMNYLDRSEKGYTLKYPTIQYVGMKKKMRLYKLGPDYYMPRAIQYRIDHKQIDFYHKPTHKYFNLQDSKFLNNRGLRNWAIKQNYRLAVEYFNSINEIQKMGDIDKVRDDIEDMWDEVGDIEDRLDTLNDEMSKVEKAIEARQQFSAYYPLIRGFNEAKKKGNAAAAQYKKDHYFEFQDYDEIVKALRPFATKDENGKTVWAKEDDLKSKLTELERTFDSEYVKYKQIHEDIANKQHLLQLKEEARKAVQQQNPLSRNTIERDR